MDSKLQLLRRMENNLPGFEKAVRGFQKARVIEMTGDVADKEAIFLCLTDALSELDQEDMILLCGFVDPLSAAIDIWHEHQAAMGGYDNVFDFLTDIRGIRPDSYDDYGDYDDFDCDDYISDRKDD